MEAKELGPSLLAAFAEVPDPRALRGRRHPLQAILTLAVAAMLAGATSLKAISEWGRLQPPETVRALGFTRERTPCVSTFHLVFRALDAGALEVILSRWVQQTGLPAAAAIAIDGKSLRSLHAQTLTGVSLVAAYSDGAGVLAQAGGRAQ